MGLIAVTLFSAILFSLHMMSSATQSSHELGSMYSLLVAINTAGSILLLVLVSLNFYWLYKQLKRRVAGSGLTTRMITLFMLLTLAPASVVFYYSTQFLDRSIDSWFDIRIDSAMEDALQLGRAALDERMRGLLHQTEQGAQILQQLSPEDYPFQLASLRDSWDDGDLTLFTAQGRILASGGSALSQMLPDLPEAGVVLQVKQGKSYIALESPGSQSQQIRVVVAVHGNELLFLQGLFAPPFHLSQLAHRVEDAYVHYKELNFLRSALKQTFMITLSLILLLSLLAAMWMAFISIRRIVAPVRRLAQGTRAVAEGRYEKRLQVHQRDELGALVASFNMMTERIAQARDEAHASRLEAEKQRAYLETLLSQLSSGVLSFDASNRLIMANKAAENILSAALSHHVGSSLEGLRLRFPHLSGLLTSLESSLMDDWHDKISFHGPEGHKALLCHGTRLMNAQMLPEGAVALVEDITALLDAQRQSAWSEVARRLAHEIKNPLTPIQLSAERLAYKLHDHLPQQEAGILDNATRTIIQQVEAMKTMVNAFADYARPAQMQMKFMQLEALIAEVLALYPPGHGIQCVLRAESNLPGIRIDPIRFRQVIHNLVKNAQEAQPFNEKSRIDFLLARIVKGKNEYLQLKVRDNGPGIPHEQMERIFEPYVTTKNRGTGLGLAIIKKIIEEHGGTIRIDHLYTDGAGLVIRLPLDHPDGTFRAVVA
ncbi:MAG: hypothetical protein RIQ52_805 [Pseudomonadota bacterium]|jgi:nitrogen fixation/metabolism regulation signal transduction histidine kinase